MLTKIKNASIYAEIGSIFNLFPAPLVTKLPKYDAELSRLSDLSKLQSDWNAVGNDIAKAMNAYEKTEYSSKD